MQQNQTLHRQQLEALAKTYSADTLTNNRIRGAKDIRGTLFVCTGTAFCSEHGHGRVQADELVPLERWQGETITYAIASVRVDNTRRSAGSFYEGLAVSFKGRKYVLTGRKVTFTPEAGTSVKVPVQKSLLDFLN